LQESAKIPIWKEEVVMDLSFETKYDQTAMTAMARALRKTVRRKRSRRSHIFGWIVVFISLFLSLWSSDAGFTIRLELRPILTFVVAIFLIAVLVWEDRLNGYFARKRLLPGTEKSSTVFKDDEFISSTDLGTSAFQYSKIQMIAEDADYFVFIFSASHAQVYDKKRISGGTPEQFRSFIENATGKRILNV